LHRIDVNTGEDLMQEVIDGLPLTPLKVSPDGRRIFYRRNDGNWFVLMAYDFETRRETELFRENRPNRFDFSLSPDGQDIILWIRNRGLHVMPAEGGHLKEVRVTGIRCCDDTLSFAGWSNDSKSVLIKQGASNGLSWVPLSGGEARTIPGQFPGIVRPDGKQIAFVRTRPNPALADAIARSQPGDLINVRTAGSHVAGIWVDPDLFRKLSSIFMAEMDPATGKVRGSVIPVAQSLVEPLSFPRWSPDGKSIAFRRGWDLIIRSLETQTERIYPGEQELHAWFRQSRESVQYRRGSFVRLDLETGKSVELANLSHFGGAGLSPDDRTLYMPRGTTQGADILILDLSRGEQRSISLPSSNGVPNYMGVVLSPDGHTLALLTTTRYDGSLATIGIDGSGYREIYTAPSGVFGGLRPVWTKDGRSILVGIGRGNQVMRFPADGRGARTFTGLEGVSSFDLSPDGKRIVFSAVAPTISSTNAP
jgi:Tol biopolymer transport system component